MLGKVEGKMRMTRSKVDGFNYNSHSELLEDLKNQTGIYLLGENLSYMITEN